MNRLKLLLALFVFTGFSALMAQTVAIKGTVTSAEDGLPIPSAAVTVKGTTVGTLTGIDGKYSITGTGWCSDYHNPVCWYEDRD